MKRVTKWVLVVGLASGITAHAAKFSIQPLQGKTEFVAVGRPAMLRIKGEAEGPSGEISLNDRLVSGNLNLRLDQLDTGISLRDEHMKKKYLETEKYPTAQLKVVKMELPVLVSGASAKEVPFSGELELHGVKHAVTGKADVERVATGYKIKSRFALALSDYKIDIPSYAGIKVADNVEINVGFEVKQ